MWRCHLFILCLIGLIGLSSCRSESSETPDNKTSGKMDVAAQEEKSILRESIQINRNITVGEYFIYLDSLVQQYDSLLPYPLSEHMLIRHNSWVIDTLANTDYYRMIARDSFVYDQRKMTVLPKGSKLKIPDSLVAQQLLLDFENTEIDINIPEFKLNIFQDSLLLHTFPVRVGQNRTRYLTMGDRPTDLRTKPGEGMIINHVKDPDFYNPVDGKQFFVTKRDDEQTTMMPQIPWIETEINGVRNGQMIHPTTNPETLGRAYSNGCIGTKEADAWFIYYYAPIGTKVKIRYDLKTYDEGQVVALLKDIYQFKD